MVAKRMYLPALRGRFGDWAYYSALMTLSQLSERVTFADKLHPKGNLSALIQRELKEGRSKEIAAYITSNEDRFFNSLVVAVYGGDPKWNEFNIDVKGQKISAEDLTDTALYSIGYLSFNRSADLFALDGQHRLAGIIEALKKAPQLGTEEVSVLFVGHAESPTGLRRTRKLFTTLNKQAKSVKKSEIIALDEADVMAIATRYLVEEHPFFNQGQVDVMRKSPNLSPDDVTHFTTIINIYDTLGILFGYVRERLNLTDRKALEVRRPKDDLLQEYKDFAVSFYVTLAKLFPDLQKYFDARNGTSILKAKRMTDQGHILFRPVGLRIFAEVLKVLRAKKSLEDAYSLIKLLPTEMGNAPYANTIWNTNTRTIKNAAAPTCRDLLLYMIGEYRNEAVLLLRYKKALGLDAAASVKLPKKIVFGART